MNEFDAWNAFWYSGRIYDYLLYKSAHNKMTDNESTEHKDEIYDKRPDNKGTEYR